MSGVCMQFANGQYFTLVLGGAGLADRQKRNQETRLKADRGICTNNAALGPTDHSRVGSADRRDLCVGRCNLRAAGGTGTRALSQ